MKTTLFLLILSCMACGSMKKKETPPKTVQVTIKDINHENFNRLIEDWPSVSKSAANSMLNKYGLPTEATDSLLLWKDTPPFEKTIVYNSELLHNFPFPHEDVIEQFISYKVPLAKVDDLWRFDGSVLLDRTKGLLSSRSDKEEMNVLALNLADEIIKGKLSVEEARLEYARSSHAFMMGNTNQYINSLNFVPASETADADVSIDLKGRRGLRPGIEAQEDHEKTMKAQESLEEEFDQNDI